MSALIIRLADYRPALANQNIKPKEKRSGLKLTEHGARILARINRGEVITDIGQIDAPTRRLLKRFLDKGYVLRGVDYAFPKEKTCWVGAAHTGEELPFSVKFREI